MTHVTTHAESPAVLLQAAAEVAEYAAAIAMQWYRTDVNVEIKGDGSPVTIADREAERAARAWLAQRFPHDGVFGEELDDERGDAPRRWILDPIDGTKAFVRGVPLWGTLVACCEGDTVIAGAACYPAVRETVAAALGEGCWWNGSRASVSRVANLHSATTLITDDRFLERPHRRAKWHALSSEAAVARTWGDCYGYLLVATGRAEAMIDDIVNPWDAAAMYPLITEAGGRFTDWRGRDTAFGGDVIATNAALGDMIRPYLVDPFDPAAGASV
ncbi:histidinol-phosphatase [Gemmatimonas sp.]|uniref:histidinol-phosphatase n=1 Tax=Gemmatimonas sp. TaxID=1962908 RepID=UPI00286AD754|nr:histidinol-phosphatase [Gemmatimonas sp.]